MHSYCYPGCNHAVTGATSPSKTRQLWIALVLIVGLAIAQLVVGWISHSLALMAESGHMLSDGFAIGLALFATWVARFSASEQATFGYRRIEILAALVNGVGLMGVAAWIAWEAVTRLQAAPTEILSGPMLITAAIGLGVNSLNAYLLHDDSQHDLNLRGAFLHMVADAISSVGVIGAAIAVWCFNWNRADSVISLGVALFIAVGTVPLIRQSLNILLEKPPEHLDLAQIQTRLNSFEGIVAVTQLRVWTIALGQDALSAQLLVSHSDGISRDRLLQQIQASLQQEFGIQEICIQMMSPLATEPVNLSIPPQIDLIRLPLEASKRDRP